MNLQPYTVPTEDADLLTCGVILTEERLADVRRFNATRSFVVTAARECIVAAPLEEKRKYRFSDRGKISYLSTILISLAGSARYPSFNPEEATRRMERIREKWGCEEFDRIMLMVRTRA